MGEGYSYKCKRCKTKYNIHLGIGMLYPNVYEKLMHDILIGEYGEEKKELVENNAYAAVNGEKELYVCGSCNRWEVGTDLSIYVPNDIEAIEREKYGVKTVKEWGHVPYVTGSDLRSKYHMIKRYYHTCPDCGKRMHKASSKEIHYLACPNCGEVNEPLGYLYWD